MSLRAEELLGEAGPLVGALDGFELRGEQLDMTRAVQRALDDGSHLMVEAGTGVGKTFAYLIPAMIHAARGGPAVVISTHTIALQEQLIHKDIPFLQKVLPIDVSAVLLKGRNNYLSIRRLTGTSLKQEDLFSAGKERNELWRIEDWAYKTQEGSLSEFSPEPDSKIWSRVRSDHGNCMGRRCATFDKCFYFKSRRKAEKAQILVVNHALLFADLALRERGVQMLPPYETVIIDEAHTIEQVAAEHFGAAVSETQIARLLNELHAGKKKRGLLSAFGGLHLVPSVDACKQDSKSFFQSLRQ